ncbi:MAG: BT_3928 family protein [Cyclobacteriaceae bacterium]
MKYLVAISRYFVGILFIFSGLIKINDPIGTAIKLEEYFEIFATDFAGFFHVFIPYSLYLSVIICVLEVVLGIAVLLYYRMHITAWILLLLIIFFTFLTFYSAFTDNVTDCGCFGDAIPLNPWQSFYKDLILLVFVSFLFIARKKVKPVLNQKKGDISMVVSAILCTAIAWYAIAHLPFIDFRPYKIGNNIETAMKPSAPLRYKYIMTKDGKKETFEEYPTDPGYEFVAMVPINPKDQPKITDYHLWTDDGEFTDASFEGNKVMIVIENVDKAKLKNLDKLREITENMPPLADVWILTSSSAAKIENFRHEYQIAAPYFYADGTVLKAMIRSNPGLILMKDGTVLGKWHINDIPESKKLKELLK